MVSPDPRPIRRVLVIGSGPDHDRSGSRVRLRRAPRPAAHCGRRGSTILVNSNPATIMTDVGVADAIYIEPLTVPVVERIIAREQPDGLLPTLGGKPD